jgi:hypothetical protein
MKPTEIEKKAEKEFKRFAKQHLLKPGKCKRIDQANYCIHQMHTLIQEFKNKFNYVPVSAQEMFTEYQNIQDRMVYENFRQSYPNVLC